MERFVCIHGHFYQPPRENPWLEAVELQDSAYPYHDWNERVTAECYEPNAAARVLNQEKLIVRIVNNYSRISYNFGPTLLAWMEDQAPEAYRAILDSDRESAERFSGHGSAMAQVYNHMIMPLANPRDKRTQVLWGLRDFRYRFERAPEGMWLSETAVDLETLDMLAEMGVRFTVLAPRQARRVRRLGGRSWHDLDGGRIDPSRAYRLRLPSGRFIDLFFYDGPISQGVAFEGLLSNGERFAHRLLEAFSDARNWPQIAHIATDGETYGHHHRQGEMALAYALQYIEENQLATLTNYGEFLERFPPTHEVQIHENSSWSCVHGIDRWRADCGCNSGGRPGWSQAWRGPLREALDWLRDDLARRFEERAREFVADPWRARDDYISVVLDRSPENVDRFIAEHAGRELNASEQTTLLKLMELQRHALLMYTSCGWFFDELSGIETVQILRYAGRALQLGQEVWGDNIESRFLERLEQAKSNLPEHRDGARIYEKFVKPATVDLRKVGAHYAISSLFETYQEQARVYCYTVDRHDYQVQQVGKTKAAVGRATLTSEITRESATMSFGVLYLGDQNLNCGVRPFYGEEAYRILVKEMAEVFTRADLPETLRTLDRHFGEATYSLKSLFVDEQRRILGPLLESTLADAEAMYRQVYQHHAPLMGFLSDLGVPLPAPFQAATELVLNNSLRQAVSADELDLPRISSLLDEARMWKVTLDAAGLAYALKNTVGRLSERLLAGPEDSTAPEQLAAVLDVIESLPFEVDLWRAQNVYYGLLQEVNSEEFWNRVQPDEKGVRTWLDRFSSLGERLGIKVADMADAESPSTITALAREIAGQLRIPRATYRLQLNRHFTFQDARNVVSYLADLGISEYYSSPLFKAGADSSHGYDVCDYGRLNPALGSEADFDELVNTLRGAGMGLILDVVPNHMGISEAGNAWWADVLENGPASVYASYFDIDWEPAKRELAGRLLLPLLEDQYGNVLERGKLGLLYEDGAFYVTYYDKRLPVNPGTYGHILGQQMESLSRTLGRDHEHVLELQSILTALSYLPPSAALPPEKMAERNREKEIIKRRVAALYEASPQVRLAIDAAVRTLNGSPADPHSYDLLDSLIDRQCYRPAYWRVATEEINYRRFFDINELAAVRVELPEVFRDTHRLVFQMLRDGKITGLRIDHPDGLWSPPTYFRDLQETYAIQQAQMRLGGADTRGGLARAVAATLLAQAEREDGEPAAWPLYVVTEKILSDGEELPTDWAVHGTSGYDFVTSVNSIFVDSSQRQAFDDIYSQFVGSRVRFRNLVNTTKKMVMLVSLASEINALALQLERIAEKNRRYRDFTLNGLTFAIREIIACLPVYRTYIIGPSRTVAPRDQAFIEAAVAEAKRRNPRTAHTIFDFVRDTLLLRHVDDFPEAERPKLGEFVMKFQQVTGPVMAKGVEDTAFYVYNRLVSLNEVGGNPEEFGAPVAVFHRINAERLRRWPHAMLATSTHDTKRGEDVRARINVLSEMPEDWSAALERWGRMNASRKTAVEGEPAPDRNDEYLLYQSILGAWPLHPMDAEEFATFRERIVNYLAKATREAKVHTSWVNPNEQYDNAVRDFVMGTLAGDGNGDNAFLVDFLELQRRVGYFGRFNSLAQVLLKIASPGVPDFYQGNEIWDFSLVDPDNRRPVDYERRRLMLGELKHRVEHAGHDLVDLAGELVDTSADGRVKLYVTYRGLAFRRAREELFRQGAYQPMEATGPQRDHLCAFARQLGDEAAVVVVPRLPLRLVGGQERPPLGEEVWADTWLVLPEEQAGRRYRNLYTGETLAVEEREGIAGLPLAAVLAHFPVALLERLPA